MDLAHVRDVEESRGVAHRGVLFEDRRVLHRHLEAGERHDARAERAVRFVERRALAGAHRGFAIPVRVLKASSVFRSSIVIVSGPTPPRDGVIRLATPSAASKSTSPTCTPSTMFTPRSTTAAPGRIQSPFTSSGVPGGGDDDVGLAHHRGEIARARVADRDRGVALEQQQRDRLADQHAATDHHRVRAGERDAVAVEHFEDAERRAGPQAGHAGEQAAGVLGMQAVDVLGGVDRLDHGFGAQRFRQRELDEDAVDVRDRD